VAAEQAAQGAGEAGCAADFVAAPCPCSTCTSSSLSFSL
ncbi:hypothetical protein PC112_g19877, partial [Phytophthora cactorum]